MQSIITTEPSVAERQDSIRQLHKLGNSKLARQIQILSEHPADEIARQAVLAELDRIALVKILRTDEMPPLSLEKPPRGEGATYDRGSALCVALAAIDGNGNSSINLEREFIDALARRTRNNYHYDQVIILAGNRKSPAIDAMVKRVKYPGFGQISTVGVELP
jgi:hypothetical protein